MKEVSHKPVLHNIEYRSFGPLTEHSMPCPVCGVKTSMLQSNTGVFQPCGDCESAGWFIGKRVSFIDRVFKKATPVHDLVLKGIRK